MSDRTDEYRHPDSGRVYRQGDPAHRFAQLTLALANECEAFLRHYQQRLAARDYLMQHTEWLSDPGRIARTMAHTIAELEKTYTAVIVDRDLPDYGLGGRDEEWHRKYGEVSP